MIKSHSFTLDFLTSQKMNPLKSLLEKDTQFKKINTWCSKVVCFTGKYYCLCFFSFSSTLEFIGDKIAAGYFKDKITPSLKENDRLKFSQDVALNNVRDKVEPRCKLSYTVLKEEDVYYPMLEISPYPTLIQLKYYLDWIHHCVTVVGKLVFVITFPFLLPLIKVSLDYFCIM